MRLPSLSASVRISPSARGKSSVPLRRIDSIFEIRHQRGRGTASSRAPLVVSLSYDILQFSARPVITNDPHATPPAGSIFARPRPPHRTGVQGIVSKVTLGSGAQEPRDGVEV